MWSKSDDLKAWTGVESFESVVQKLGEMASKKKQDEKNLKILRELVSVTCNKHCFDCQQRGPTYVNMTIGSFVCTTCSGLLRGLTPPQRVKSISMASFTDEEILMLKNRGNDYCRRVWLGLYDPSQVTDVSDESHVRDFMVNKYERKRFYLDPSKVTFPSPAQVKPVQPPHNLASSSSTPNHTPISLPRTAPSSSNNNHAPVSRLNNGYARKDPFSPVTSTPPTFTQQDNFANFDNNPIFNSSTVTNSTPTKQQKCVYSQDLGFLNSAYSTPVPSAFTPNNNFSWFNPWASVPPSSTSSTPLQAGPPNPAQDRYAALKDLDSLMRANTSTSSWGANGSSSGSLFDSSPPQPTPGSPPSSVFLASPADSAMSSPGNPFMAAAQQQQQQQQPSGLVGGNGNPWGSPPSFAAAFPPTNPFDVPQTNGVMGNQAPQVSEGWAFKDSAPAGTFGSPFSSGFGQTTPENNNKNWGFTGNNFNNPFSLGNGASAKSSNPFL